jgi:putative ABC transport system permease protein
VASDLPLGGGFVTAEIALAGDTAPRPAYYHRVGPGYFRTIGMTIVQGRDFTDEDLGDLARAPEARLAAPGIGTVVVNETTARAFWPGGEAIGQTLSTSFDPRLSARRVIGVVRDARSETLRQAAPAEVYTPYLEDPSFAMTVLVRTRLPVDRVVPAIRQQVREVSADISLANVRTLDGLRADALRPSRFNALVVSAFAGAGLVIAAVGVFGVFAFGVAARLREIGVRIALGAAPRDIVRLFLAQAAWPVAAGVACGALGAVALGRFIAALLFEVAPSDPASFVAAAGLLAAVAMLASYLPVRRALRADPVQTLRR